MQSYGSVCHDVSFASFGMRSGSSGFGRQRLDDITVVAVFQANTPATRAGTSSKGTLNCDASPRATASTELRYSTAAVPTTACNVVQACHENRVQANSWSQPRVT